MSASRPQSAVLRTDPRPWSAPRAILLGALAVGVLDGLDALVFFGLRGVPPARIGQSIAAGLLGRDAFAGGVPAALLGLLLHFCVAAAIVGVYVAAARRWPGLARRPLLYGPPYGIIAWAVMQYIVIPLSAAPAGSRAPAVIANGILIHIFGVGLPAALAAARTGRSTRPARP